MESINFWIMNQDITYMFLFELFTYGHITCVTDFDVYQVLTFAWRESLTIECSGG